MTVLIRCQDCPVISLGKTVETAREQFMWHDEFFAGIEGHTGGSVGATETVVGDLDTGTWETRSEGAEGQGEPHE